LTVTEQVRTKRGPWLDRLRGRSLIEWVEARTPGDSRLDMCIQCGTCGGSCPSGQDMDHTPRQLFAMLRAELEDEVLESNTPWFCVSCYLCTSRCPQEVKITDIMYTIKTLAVSKGISHANTARDFSETFIGYVERYGRSFEFGLATRHSLYHMPTSFTGTIELGLGMLTKGRMDMTPHKIKDIHQLQKILARAKELEAQL
jgi:heterodisulfide reductase subunit C